MMRVRRQRAGRWVVAAAAAGYRSLVVSAAVLDLLAAREGSVVSGSGGCTREGAEAEGEKINCIYAYIYIHNHKHRSPLTATSTPQLAIAIAIAVQLYSLLSCYTALAAGGVCCDVLRAAPAFEDRAHRANLEAQF